MKSRARPSRARQAEIRTPAAYAAVTLDNSLMLEQMREAQAQEGQQGGALRGMSGGGPAPGSFGWGLLSGEQRELQTQARDHRGHGLGKDVHVKENVIDGKWADTLQGQRVNDGAGAGIFDEDHAHGGRQGWAMDECKDWGKKIAAGGAAASLTGAVGAAMTGVAAPTSVGILTVGVGGSLLLGGAAYLICEANQSLIGKPSIFDTDSSKKRPRDDQDSGGGYVPVVVGHNRPGAVGDTGRGRAGGRGDGRGADQGASSQGPVLLSDISIAQHGGGRVDAPEREIQGSAVSYETMLAESFHTDPSRT